MDRTHIIQEIRRTAKMNKGVPLGSRRFFSETGIKVADWHGKYWVRWSEAVEEAGFSSNKFTESYDEKTLFSNYIALIRELGHLPVVGDLRIKIRKDPTFPNDKTFSTHFGSKSRFIAKLIEFCQGQTGYQDIVQLCSAYNPRKENVSNELELNEVKIGFVYLLKHGSRREYKIGKTFNPIRREGEIAIQLPEKLEPIHYIKTDDPSGIEQYWHSRFATKRKEGEWFALEAGDVRAFKRWRSIY